MNPLRRRLMLGLGGMLVSGSSMGKTLLETPRQTAGPFYPLQLPLDDDNDLTQVKGYKGIARGRITELGGRIVDIKGNPLSGLKIEIWQCDANGRYRHPREQSRRPSDPGFQGHGQTFSNHRGEYRFRTIHPVKYPGRTPHIHVAVFAEGESPFVTQLYAAGNPHNESDFLYNSITYEKHKLVTAEFRPSDTPGVELQASFDIILNRQNGTPFQ